MNNKQKLAERIVNYSIHVKPEEKVLVQYSDCDDEFLECLQKEILKARAYPFFKCINRALHKNELIIGNQKLFELKTKYDEVLYRDMDCIILIGGSNNIYDYANVNTKIKEIYDKIYTQCIHFDIRIKKRWVLLRYPSASFAQLAEMGTKEFEQYFFDVCSLDYEKMDKACVALKKLMERSDRVKIVAPGTHLEFSIKGLPAIICSGQCNLPDGEVYTAPVKDSINGEITFNVPAMQGGLKFENIHLTFKNGKVVNFDCNNNKEFEKILNLDDGSRYVGEFSFGINPYVTKSINDILFDEKMCGSLHMALGCSYDDCNNTNKSVLHWDLILNQTPEYGGGEIWLDGVKVRENGKFILPELVALNPENLV